VRTFSGPVKLFTAVIYFCNQLEFYGTGPFQFFRLKKGKMKVLKYQFVRARSFALFFMYFGFSTFAAPCPKGKTEIFKIVTNNCTVLKYSQIWLPTMIEI
jgi:hypothetical protein